MQRGVLFTDDCERRIWVAVDKDARAVCVEEDTGYCQLHLAGGNLVCVDDCFDDVLSKLGLIVVDKGSGV